MSPGLELAANVVVAFVALSHAGFLVLEMFLFTTPVGRKIFRTDPEFAERAAPLAANQGLYNGFLAAGLCWGLATPNPLVALHFKVFFLICVVVAGIYGALSVSRRIFVIQAVPALVGLLLLWMANR